MKKYALFLLSVVAISLLAPAAFAQETGAAAASACKLGRDHLGLRHGDRLGRRRLRSGQSHGRRLRRTRPQPGAAAAIRFALILALVLIESMALYTFAIVFLKVK